MQIKTTLRFLLTSVRMIITNNTNNMTNVRKDVANQESLNTVGGNVN
jgi:hypothetical protein